VTNLDTCEKIPLSLAEEKIPKCINPLSLHIMRLTSEYVSRSEPKDSDEESVDSKISSVVSTEDGDTNTAGRVRKRTAKLRRFLGTTVKKTVDMAKSAKSSIPHRKKKEEVDISINEDPASLEAEPLVKMKASHRHKGPYDFDNMQQIQDLSGEHTGPVWCMEFSNCGRLLATAGKLKIFFSNLVN